LGFALLGWGVTGAFGGFALAAALIALIAAWRVGLGPKGEPSPYKDVYGFALQAMAYTLVFNLIFKLDLLMVKPVAQQLFAESADRLMGVYGMAVNVSRLPWQATIAVTFVIFPMLSEATFSQDMERARGYIRQTLRYLMLLIGAASAGLMALPEAVVNILPADYAMASHVLMWSAPAYFFFTLFNLTNTLLMSAGRALDAFVIGALTVGLAAVLYSGWLPQCTEEVGLISAAAQASLIAFAVGLALGLGRLAQLFGPPVPMMSALRLAASSAGVWFVGRQLAAALAGQGKLVFLVALVALGLLYFVFLTLLREWDADDKARVQRLLKRT
jgi:O-antigen/teichoic acid export membrane protein